MLKKTFFIFMAIVFVFAVAYTYFCPKLSTAENVYTVYTNSSSSNANISKKNLWEYLLTENVTGESVQVSKSKASEIIKRLKASTVFTENVSGTNCVYYYTKKINNSKTVKGKRVNLQVAFKGENVIMGTPLIFGAF